MNDNELKEIVDLLCIAINGKKEEICKPLKESINDLRGLGELSDNEIKVIFKQGEKYKYEKTLIWLDELCDEEQEKQNE